MAATSHETRALIVTIAGLADKGASLYAPRGPLPLTYDAPAPASSRWDTGYARIVVPGSVTVGEVSISLLFGEPKQGGLSFEVRLLDEHYPEVTEFFLETPRFPIATLASDIGATDTSFTVQTGEGATFDGYQNDLVWISREAFRVTSRSGDTINFLDELDDGTTRSGNGAVGVVGHAGTYVQEHTAPDSAAGYPVSDGQVWGKSTHWRARPVDLWTSDGTTETRIGRFVMHGREVTSSGTRVRVTCDDLLTTLKSRQFNRDPVRLSFDRVTNVGFAGATEEGYATATGVLLGGADGAHWIYAKDIAFDPPTRRYTDPFAGVIACGDAVFVCDGSSSNSTYYPSLNGEGADDTFIVSAKLTGRYRSTEIDGTKLIGKVGHEVLVSDPAVFDPSKDSEHPYYFDSDGDGTPDAIATHPLDMVRCHLGVVASNLPKNWVVSEGHLPDGWVNDDDIRRLRDTVFAGVTAPGVFAGADGDPVAAFEWMHETFLSMLGAGFTTDAEGRLTIRSILDAGASSATQVTATHILPGRPIDSDPDGIFDRILCRVGIGLEEKEPSAELEIRSGVRREWLVHDDSTLEMPAGAAWSADRPYSPGQLDDLVARMATILDLFRSAPLQHTVEVTGAVDVEVGRFYTFAGPGFRTSSNGRLLASGETVTLYGFVRSRSVDLQSGKQTVVVIEMPFADKRIGSALDVVSTATVTGGDGLTDTWVTVTEKRFVLPFGTDGTTYVYDADSAGIDEDVKQMAVDLAAYGPFKVKIVSKRGVTKTNDLDLIAVDAANNRVRLDGTLTIPGGGIGYVYAAGDRLKCSAYTVQTNTAYRDAYAYIGRDRYTL